MDIFKSRIGEKQRSDAFGLAMATGLVALSMAAQLALPAWMGIERHKPPMPPMPTGPTLVQLPIPIEPGQSHRQLARRMVKEDAFMALALGVEASPERAYVDSAGANAGAGYCIEMRRRALGESLVRDEMARAGFPQIDIEGLLSRNKSRIEAVRMGQAQSLRLLVISKPQYQAMARKAVGASVFDALPPNKRDVLSYLAYNTGGPGKFVKLIAAVRAGNDRAALSQLAPSVSVGKGKRLKNHRLRAWAQASWVGTDELKKALERPVAFELAYADRTGQSKFIEAHTVFLAALTQKMAAKKNSLNSPAGAGAGARKDNVIDPTKRALIVPIHPLLLAKKRAEKAQAKPMARGHQSGFSKKKSKLSKI